ncbi:hypothetical protein [Streptomyces sp. NPDC006739]|uniref:hypothetical protein n=1 Tax=Streptomyces sp. NPDC006739 TaxID=3364763 RepID=UPI0036C08DA9
MMHCALSSRTARMLAAGALSAALVSGGTTGAFATGSSPMPTTAASITIRANKTTVKAGNAVRFTGRTKGLKIGSVLVLQHQQGTKWTNLKAGTKVRRGSSYSLTARLNTKGTEHLRVVSGMTHSPVVTVKVT